MPRTRKAQMDIEGVQAQAAPKLKKGVDPEMMKAPYYKGEDNAFILTVEDWKACLDLCKQAEICGWDIETTGKDPYKDTIHGFSLSWAPGCGRYVYWSFIEQHRELCTKDMNALRLVTHGGKFDFHFTAEHWPELDPTIEADTMLLLHLEDPDQKKDLKGSAWRHLKVHMMTLPECLGIKEEEWDQSKIVIDFDKVPKERLLQYGCGDADLTRQLYFQKVKDIRDNFGKAESVDVPLQVPVLRDIERWGLNIDKKYLEALVPIFERCLVRMQKNIYDVVGHQFDIESPQQVGKVLFDEMGLTPLKYTKKTLRPSTTADDLEKLAKSTDNEVLSWIVEYKHHKHSLTAYVNGTLNGVGPKTGRLHAEYMVCGAPTYRLACIGGKLDGGSLNVQQVPKDPEELEVELADEEKDRLIAAGVEVKPGTNGLSRVVYMARKAFVASPGRYLVSADYQAVEFRIMVNHSGEKGIGVAIRSGKDAHLFVSQIIYRKPEEDVSKPERDAVKALCLHPDTYIWSNGMQRIGEARVGDTTKLPFSKGDGNISAVYKRQRPECVKITTKAGFRVTGSLEHKFYVMRKGTPEWVCLQDIKPGDWVGIKVGDNFSGEWPKFKDREYQDRNFIDVEKRWVPGKRLTKEWCLFLGLLLGDGCMHKDAGMLSMHSEDEDELRELQRVSKSATGKAGSYFKCLDRKGWTWRLGYAPVVRFLERLGGVEPRNKYIPDIVLRAPKEGLCALLRGLYSTDGSNTRSQIGVRFASTSETMAHQVHQILLRLGIRARIAPDLSNNRKNRRYKVLWVVTIGSYEDAVRFRDLIGFVMRRKNKSLEKSLSRSRARKDNFYIPQQESRLRVIAGLEDQGGRGVGGISKLKCGAVQGRIRDKLKECIRGHGAVRLSPKRWEMVRKQLQSKKLLIPEAQDIDKVASTGFWWDEVRSKEHGIGGEFFDITVPGEHAFVANGFVSKNSYGLAYGMQPWGLKERLGISEEMAIELYNAYFRSFPRIKQYIQAVQRRARRDGFIVTAGGRRRFVEKEYETSRSRGDRSSINTTIQGSAADVMRMALVKTYYYMRDKYGDKVWLIATLHDQILFDVDKSIPLEEFVKDVKKAMEMDRKEWLCPIVVDVGYGDRWSPMEEYGKKKKANKGKNKKIWLEALKVIPVDLMDELNMMVQGMIEGETPVLLKMGDREAAIRTVKFDKTAIQKFEEILGDFIRVRVEDVVEPEPVELAEGHK